MSLLLLFSKSVSSTLVAGSIQAFLLGSNFVVVNHTARPTGQTGRCTVQLQRSPDNSTWSNIGSAQGLLQITDSTVSPGTAYFYRCQYNDGAGVPVNSASINPMTMADTSSVVKQYLPARVAVVEAAATGATSQWTGFRSTIQSALASLANVDYDFTGYEGDSLTRCADAALAYDALKFSNPSLAAQFADYALGRIRYGIRGNQRGQSYDHTPMHVGSYGAYILLGIGDGSTTTFTLPNTPTSGLQVKVGPTGITAITKGAANGSDAIPSQDYRIVAVGNTSGASDYVYQQDWQYGVESDNASVTAQIDWSPTGIEPATSATYYVKWASEAQAATKALTTDYTWGGGTTITFTSAPASGQAVWAAYLFTEADGRTNQLTYDGLGYMDDVALDGPGYATRYLQFIPIGVDLLWDYSGFTAARKAEVISWLIRWNNWVKVYAVGAYELNKEAASNYGDGAYAFRVAIAIAVANRESQQAATLKADAIALYTTGSNSVAAMLAAPVGSGSSSIVPVGTNHGGHWSEGWNYGVFAIHNATVGTEAMKAAGWITPTAYETWLGTVGRAMFTEQQAANLIYPGGDGYSSPFYFPGQSASGDTTRKFLYAAALYSSDSTSSALWNWDFQNTTGSDSGDWYDVMFRVPGAAATAPATAGLSTGTLFDGIGLSVFRKDYSYSTTVGFINCGNLTAAAHQALAQGVLEIWRGSDNLLARYEALTGDQTFQNKSKFGNILNVDDQGAGQQNYSSVGGQGPSQGGGWFTGPTGCLVSKWNNQAGYYYQTGDYWAAYGHSSVGNPNPLSEANDSILYIRGSGTSDYIIRHQRMTSTDVNLQGGALSYVKTAQWQFDPAATLSTSGDTFTVANGSSKLFGHCYSDVPLTSTQGTCPTFGGVTVPRFTNTPTTNNHAKFRVLTAMQTSPSAVGSMDATTYLGLSSDTKNRGVLIGHTAAVFGADGAISGGTSYSLTDTNGQTTTHYVADLLPNTSYTLAGTIPSSVTTDSAGVANFTSTGTGSAQTITLSATVAATTYSVSASPNPVAANGTSTVTVTPNGTSSVTVNIPILSGGGSLSAASVTFDGSATPKSVTFNAPGTAGATVLGPFTNTGSLTNPGNYTITTSSASRMTPGPYVAFAWNAPIGSPQRMTEAIFTVATSNAASVLAAMNSSWPAVRCQTTANDFFGNDGIGRGGLGQQHSALTQDNSGTFGPFYDGAVLTGPATTFFTALKNAGLSASAPLLVWLDSESQNFYATYTAAQLNSIAADTRAAPLIAAVGSSNLAALTTSQQEAFDSWVAGQYDAALTLLANAIKAVFPNAFVCNFNSVQISQAIQQVDGGGTPYYRSSPPTASVSSPEVYDDLSRNVLTYNYQINGASVNWRDPFFNLVFLLNRSRACRASNPSNGFIAEIANYTDTDLGEGALVPLSLTPYWGELVRHQSLMSTFGGSLLDFNPFHHTQDSTCDAVMLDVLTAAHGKPPQTLWTTAQIGYTPTDGVYTYVTLSDGTTLGRFTFAGATQSVTITTPDNKNFTLNRPFGQVGMWFGIALSTPFSVPPPGGFLLFDLSTPGKRLQVAYAI